MVRNPATGKLTFSWDTSGANKGNPQYTDDNVHRVYSLLMEQRASSGPDGGMGWMWDVDDRRGSKLYTVKNVFRSTPSQLESFALDALQKGVDEGWFTDPTAKAYLSPVTRARLEVSWKNPTGQVQVLKLGLAKTGV